MNILALIDSGSDDCLFSLGVARLLGLDLSPERDNRYVGIGGTEVVALFGTVRLDVGDFSYSVYAGFVDTTLPLALLGQNGFFDQFMITFNLRRGAIEIQSDDVER